MKIVYSARMFENITVNAPAKINLGLQVFPKRSDGYHNIESIFTTVALYDTITVSLTDKPGKCLVDCCGMNLPAENTFTQAYKAFCVLTGKDYGCSVKVTKRIPSGGGLGGGSTDASSFLQSMDMLCGTKLTAKDYCSLSGLVGSDVYFFTHALLEGKENDCYTAIVTGRGENVSQLGARKDYAVLLLFPPVSVSTRTAYSLVDGRQKRDDKSIENLESVYRKPVEQWSFVNDFTSPICDTFPVICNALDDVRKSGALFSDMSGSGSTVFGIYKDADAAQRAKLALSKWNTVLALW